MRLTVLLLLLGAAVVLIDLADRPAAKRSAGVAGPVLELPPAPEPFPGGGSDCTEPDPAGADEGCVTPATAWLAERLHERFDAPMTCWSEHAWNPESDHPRGRACDLFYGPSGGFAEGEDLAEGWRAAQWLRVHAEALEVHYVIWAGRIWVADRAELGWRPYDGGGVYDPEDGTGGHYDHVHISVRRAVTAR